MDALMRQPSISVEDRGQTEDAGQFENVKRLILMPIDGSEHSERAFTWYLDNIMQDNDGLYLVHIIEPQGLNYGLSSKSTGVKDDVTNHISSLVEEGRQLLKKYLFRCENAGVVARFTIHVGSKPGELIVKLTNEQAVHMVVIGNRGLGSVKRTFLGSVSDYIIHNAHTPVVIVPPTRKVKKK